MYNIIESVNVVTVWVDDEVSVGRDDIGSQ